MRNSFFNISRIIVFLLSFVAFSCNVFMKNVVSSSITEDNSIYVINIYKLMDSVKKYHGKTVQTTGYFSLGFEDCSLSMPKAVYENNKFTFTTKDLFSLWVEFDYNLVTYNRLDSLGYRLSGKLTTLQGVIDTTMTGHLGFYKCGLIKARVIVSK